MTLIDSKTLIIGFDKIDAIIKVYDGIRYLVLFGPEKYGAIYNRIWYLISQESGLNMFSLIVMQLIQLIRMILNI